MRQRSENLGESPCPSAIARYAGRASPRFSRKHCKPEISKRSNIFTDKRNARFSLKSKLFKTEDYFCLEKDSSLDKGPRRRRRIEFCRGKKRRKKIEQQFRKLFTFFPLSGIETQY